MPEHESLLAQLASMRERAESLRHAAGEEFPATSLIGSRLTLLVAELASLELDIREGARNHHQPLTPAQVQLAASAVAEKLRRVVIVDRGLSSGQLPSIISPLEPQKPS